MAETQDQSLDETIDITAGKCSGDIAYGPLVFLRNNCPNGRAPALMRDEKDGAPFLRLAVARGAYTKATLGDPIQNDRCELRDAKVKLGTPVWYSFELRAAPEFPEVDARCVCAQIKAPYYDLDGGSPLFALRIDHGRYIATIEHLYERSDVSFDHGVEVSRYVTPHVAENGCLRGAVRAYDHHIFPNAPGDALELQVRALLATDERGLPEHLERQFDSCTTGVRVRSGGALPNDIHEWHRFTVKVAATEVKDADGILQLFVAAPDEHGDGALVAEVIGELGHAGSLDSDTNTGPPPGDGQQYFKLGPYRDKWAIWDDAVAAIDVRNIRRCAWPEGAARRAALATKAET